MAFLIDEKRFTSSTSSTQVKAVIGPTAGMVMSRSRRSANSESRWSDRTRADSVFCRRTSVSRQSRSSGRRPSGVSGFGCQELFEVTHLVQLLFVIAHAPPHDRKGDFIFQLHGLVDQQI